MSSIREARADERDKLSALAFRSKAHWGYSTEFMEACRDELSVDADQIESAWVIERAGEVLGFYGLDDLGGRRVELDFLFVEPRAIGEGLGRALMGHAIETARDGGFEVMEIQGDPNAERFYLAAGAVRVGDKPSASIPGRVLPLFEIALAALR